MISSINKIKKPIVFLACSGLGYINRGYESFSRECFDALKNNDCFDMYLMKGGGRKSRRGIIVNNFRREGATAKFLSKLLNKPAYLIEQFSFCFFLLPHIIKRKPSVIYYSDFLLGTYLWHLRKLLKFKYRLLFANGAPNEPPFKTEDHVQQLIPFYLDKAIAKGEPLSKQTLLPYGFNIDVQKKTEAIKQKALVRQKLDLPAQAKIILSVGAVNVQNKRMDYLVNEVALLDESYYLLLLGQHDEETKAIKQLAKLKLPGRHCIMSVPFHQVSSYYIAADYFILASLSEGFGRVFIEALSYGLPCFANNSITAKQVLKEYGIYVDMTKTNAIADAIQANDDFLNRQQLIKAAYDLYSWEVLKKYYIKMIAQQLSLVA